MSGSGGCGVRILVVEKRPRWAPELQRQFLGEEVRVGACRAAAEVFPKLKESPRNLLVLDLDAAPAECMQLLGRFVGRPHSPVAIAVGSMRTAALEWPVRELGAVGFVSDSVSGEELARLCRRQW